MGCKASQNSLGLLVTEHGTVNVVDQQVQVLLQAPDHQIKNRQ